jgi:hypothetical protein
MRRKRPFSVEASCIGDKFLYDWPCGGELDKKAESREKGKGEL